ncbi:helix-hairpin-helix domain-containing protein [Natroniella sp. ANB-PHB2]|uniref:helix-hairpin-helix domain-containing protein n=1 Tax=Natroniella sp. ANB-PHB2 TaxID=3384444 RepID=UPI0038D5004C
MIRKLTSDVIFEILSPTEQTIKDLNNASIVGRLGYQDVSLMLTGDAEKDAESEMINNHNNLASTVLKVGHHGSNTSTTNDFLKEVNPEVAIIQVGADNRYGHPSQVVLNRLEQNGVDIYRTDQHGDILMITDGVNYSISHTSTTDLNQNTSSRKINVNTANHQKLQEITGVGPVVARKIIEYRTTYGAFKNIKEIKNISGIAEIRFEEMKDEITI